MPRTTYVLRNGELVEKHLAEPLHRGDPTIHVIRDQMDPVRNMADGRMYDSKSVYRRAVHSAGCRIVGNDKVTPSSAPLPRAGPDIRRAIAQLSSR
jgi:hypothetical protein